MCGIWTSTASDHVNGENSTDASTSLERWFAFAWLFYGFVQTIKAVRHLAFFVIAVLHRLRVLELFVAVFHGLSPRRSTVIRATPGTCVLATSPQNAHRKPVSADGQPRCRRIPTLCDLCAMMAFLLKIDHRTSLPKGSGPMRRQSVCRAPLWHGGRITGARCPVSTEEATP